MGRFLFFKLLAVLVFFVSGGILAGTALADININFNIVREGYSEQINKQVNEEVEPVTREQSDSAGEKVVISMVGDVLLASGVGQAMAVHGPDYPWRGTSEVLRESDITIANLECAVSTGGSPEPDKQFTFRALPDALAGAADAGVDVLTLANNHILDFGREAMLDTINNIKGIDIYYTGAGINEDEAFKPVFLQKKGKNVAVLAFTRVFPRSGWIAGKNTPGVASGFNYRLMMDRIEAAESQADETIVLIHWGNEADDFPGPDEINLAHALVDAGADIVAGHHPHVLQGIEVYKGKIIAYSLGNFIFTTSSSRKAREGVILQVAVGSTGSYKAGVIPTGITGGATRILRGGERKSVLDRINQLSGPFGTSVDTNGVVRIQDPNPMPQAAPTDNENKSTN
jgi:poly-gamma-glutamate synthesis protein (capsule biosynthesis protein)